MNPKNSRFTTELDDNPEQIMKHQLNNSRAKMQYSFSQSQRFNESQQLSASPSKFYDLPSLWGKKGGASMGKSNRVDFSKQNVTTPSPNKYSVFSSFSTGKGAGKTIGLGRQQVKYRNMFNQKMKQAPEPASYRPLPPFNTRAYTLGKKLQNNYNKWIGQVPGPGNYPVVELTNSRHKKIISKYLSANTSAFSKKERDGLALNSVAPGPGKYQVKSQSFDQSIFDKPYAAKFTVGKRRGLSDNPLATPGPGSYKAFSEFKK